MATLTINGKEVTVEDNTLILDAAKEAGYDVPTFCYQADLSRIGACRMCLIEIEGTHKLQPACVTPVMPDMIVNTESKKCLTSRSAMFEFLLSNHALDCPVCDKAGECELQDMVYKHGPHKGKYAENKIRFHERDYYLSPVIVKNSNRCVKCLRCVRVCRDAVGVGVLGSLGRGANQEETSFLKTYLDCDHCGNCIEVCPVGCYMRRPYRYTARPWDLESAATVCPYCATGCKTNVQSRDGKVVRSIAKWGKGVNHEMLCARGRFGLDYINSGDRLTTPLLKNEEGDFDEITWDEAFKVIKERSARFTGDRIGGIASARLTNEELYSFQSLIRDCFKSANIDSSTRWSGPAVEAFIKATGSAEGGVSLWDAMEGDSVFIVGSHLSDENPVTDYLLRRAFDTRRVTAIVASSRSMKLDSSAQINLRHEPAEEGALLTAIAIKLFSANAEKLIDFEFASELKGADPDAFISQAGLNASDIDLIAERFKFAGSISIIAGTEFLKYPGSIRGLHVLRQLILALGKKLIVLPVLDRSNQRGAWDMGVHPAFGPDYIPVDKPGLDADQMIDAAGGRQIDMLYIAAEDLVNSFRDWEFATAALEKLNFLIVQDSFMTSTAKLADIILPGATFAEKEGTLTNQEGRVQELSSLRKAPGEAKSDLDIFAAIHKSFDYDFDLSSADKAFAEIKATVKGYADVECVDGMSDSSMTGKAGGSLDPALLGASDDKAKRDEAPYSEAMPFTLVTGNHLYFSGTLSRRSEVLRGLLVEPVVEISEADAEKFGFTTGDRVKVIGRHHEAIFSIRTRRGSLDGLAFIPENYPEAPVNKFFKRNEPLLQKLTIKKA